MGQSNSNVRSLALGPTVAAQIHFYVLCGNEPTRASVNAGDSLVELFTSLREDPTLSWHIPAQVTWRECAFYRLKNPVLFAQPKLQEGDAFLRQAKQRCEEVGNRWHVEPITTTVRQLAEQFSPDYAYLVIELPDPSLQFENVTKELSQSHAMLFECLRVKVGHLGSWAAADIEGNQKDGVLTEDIAELPSAFQEIQNALQSPRFYKASNVEGSQDYKVLREWYGKEFDCIFVAADTESPGLVTYREFAAFYNLLRGFDEDVLRIAGHSISSSFRASNFVMHFVHPPFFSLLSCRFEYWQDALWSFPMFVEAANPPNAFRKFVPKSDCMVVSSRLEIPFLICEVISHKYEHDRSRLLIQATVLARTGQLLLQPTSMKKFFVVAIYVDANMVASRYIVMQDRDGNTSDNRMPVSIHQKNFDLRAKDQQLHFLREMYNLVTLVDALSSELAPSKQGYLHDIHMAASKVMSLSNEDRAQTTDDASMHSMTSSA
ncbi:hypothetical protein L210DRAFT_3517879 [Boletus edulis BED1]|uniref:Uncharacterized protein n=1 Tax=Boletus edulis BED1 TaxID=1328754 RepID=A0AAD4GN11_BOLED|nr:hypothetical protein L210DRAFT_3517879 [Boletus edulis BED1]